MFYTEFGVFCRFLFFLGFKILVGSNSVNFDLRIFAKKDQFETKNRVIKKSLEIYISFDYLKKPFWNFTEFCSDFPASTKRHLEISQNSVPISQLPQNGILKFHRILSRFPASTKRHHDSILLRSNLSNLELISIYSKYFDSTQK